MSYTLHDYGTMIADTIRMEVYRKALRQEVRPGSTVLDIGTGLGTFAGLACQCGARKVYAIDSDEAIVVAQEIAEASGLGGRVEFIQNVSKVLRLSEPVDIIVSDLRGVLPVYQNHLRTIIDARERLLAPNGVLVPRSDTLWAAVVEAAELYDRHTRPWLPNDYGFDMMPASRLLTNTWRKTRIKADQLLAEPWCWKTLDYRTLGNPNLDATIVWTAARAGTAHGLCLWFDSTLAEGIHLSNSPHCPDLIYGTGFFPLSEAVHILPRDKVRVRLRANLVGDDYLWCWDTDVLEHGDPNRIKVKFNQSTFFSTPRSTAKVHKLTSTFSPSLGEKGQIAKSVLEQMAEGTTLGQIANRIAIQFPRTFNDVEDALTWVGELSLEYSD